MAQGVLLSILIPTYNRQTELLKNINMLSGYIRELEFQDIIEIIISDNCSEDDTVTTVEKYINTNKDIKIRLYKQPENLGLERNAVFVLSKSTAKYVMYLGDDDFLPTGYIEYVLRVIKRDKDTTCIIPGITANYLNGMTKINRDGNFEVKKFRPSFGSILYLARYGHQLSGIVLKRENLFQAYCNNPKYRNLYPFIFFVSYNLRRGNAYFLPKFKVLVTVGNNKDWAYDDAGLIPDIFQNFRMLYPQDHFKRNLLNITFLFQQPWRLRIEKDLRRSLKSFLFLLNSKRVDLVIKLLLPYLYTAIFVQKIFRFTVKKIT